MIKFFYKKNNPTGVLTPLAGILRIIKIAATEHLHPTDVILFGEI